MIGIALLGISGRYIFKAIKNKFDKAHQTCKHLQKVEPNKYKVCYLTAKILFLQNSIGILSKAKNKCNSIKYSKKCVERVNKYITKNQEKIKYLSKKLTILKQITKG
jgi:hypothetical protein